MNYFRIDFLLFHKWILFNIIGLMLSLYVQQYGWLTTLIISDLSYITPAIMILSLFGIIMTGYWAYKITKELQSVKRGEITTVLGRFYPNPDKFNFGDAKNLESLKLLLSSRIMFIRHIAWALVLMGLIGTVLGFILVLLSIDPASVSNIEALPKTMAEITAGLGVALYTTLSGSVGNLWILINFNMLATATVQLYSYIITNHEVIEEN